MVTRAPGHCTARTPRAAPGRPGTPCLSTRTLVPNSSPVKRQYCSCVCRLDWNDALYEGCDSFRHNMSDLEQKRKRRINVKRKGPVTPSESEREDKRILHASARGRVSRLSFEFGLPMITL